MGDSGNAEDTGSHLHFEIHLGGYVSATGSQTRYPSAIDPYASLKAAPTLAEWLAAGRSPRALRRSDHGPGTSTTTTSEAHDDHHDHGQAHHDHGAQAHHDHHYLSTWVPGLHRRSYHRLVLHRLRPGGRPVWSPSGPTAGSVPTPGVASVVHGVPGARDGSRRA